MIAVNPRFLTIVLFLFAAAVLPAQEKSAQSGGTSESQSAAEEAVEGILPLPEYGGDFWERRYLTGDWGGTRADLAKKGLFFELEWTQVGQGIVDGGRDERAEYHGSFDYVLNVDFQRMGLIPGALLKIRAESRYGESVNGQSGAILPVNTDAFFPLTDPGDEDIAIALTELTYVQFLSRSFGVFLGKLQTLDGDPNEFAGGRGRSQFMNFNFIANGVGAVTVPYSTLGGGLLWMASPNITLQTTMMLTTDSSTETGFHDFDDGWTSATEAQFQYQLGTLPGGQNVGFGLAFDGDFTSLPLQLQLVPGQGVQLKSHNTSWMGYWSAWQYLWTPDNAPPRIDTTNGRPDIRGIGLFARVGFADDETNPIDLTASIGLGARGLIPGRDNDQMGLAYLYTDLHDFGGVGTRLNIEGSTQAIEAYYNLAFTGAIELTFDVQWIDSAANGVDDSTILGARLNIRF